MAPRPSEAWAEGEHIEALLDTTNLLDGAGATEADPQPFRSPTVVEARG